MSLSPVSKSIAPTPAQLGDSCLQFLAETPEQLADFMATTGYTPDGLRKSLGGDQLARGLIDYFASNEPLLLAFCANQSMTPDAFMRVWARLNPAG